MSSEEQPCFQTSGNAFVHMIKLLLFIWRQLAYLKNSKTPNLETWFSLDSDSQYVKLGTLTSGFTQETISIYLLQF